MHQSSKEKMITSLMKHDHSTYHEALHWGSQSSDTEVSGEFAPAHPKWRAKPRRTH
ncbi:hypothetical protein [Paenibacillus albiflavus]|uniref:hypothetical protein n=1 Tax=Paenibacillus albiflavus TaxID=2545760 RepID=UPI001404CBEF|nr:hypothetical protein [Paenibacillus albiflavus]